MATRKNEFPRLTPSFHLTKARRLLEGIRKATCPAEAVRMMGIVKSIARDEKARPEVRLKAVEIYLDRTIGKPEQNANQDYIDQLRMQMAELQLMESQLDINEKLENQRQRHQDSGGSLGDETGADALPSLPPPPAEEDIV